MYGLDQCFSAFLVLVTPYKVSLILPTPSPKLSGIADPLGTDSFKLKVGMFEDKKYRPIQNVKF
jgi:hypothetical protein